MKNIRVIIYELSTTPNESKESLTVLLLNSIPATTRGVTPTAKFKTTNTQPKKKKNLKPQKLTQHIDIEKQNMV